MDKIYGNGDVQPGLPPLPLNGGIHGTKPRQGPTSSHDTTHIETQVTISRKTPSNQREETISNIFTYVHTTRLALLTSRQSNIFVHNYTISLRGHQPSNTFKGHIFCQSTKTLRWTHFLYFYKYTTIGPPPFISPLYFWQRLHHTRAKTQIFVTLNIYTRVIRPPIYSEHSLISRYLATY